MSITITPLTDGHADEVLAIYQAGIDEGNATFETTAPTWTEFDAARLPEHASPRSTPTARCSGGLPPPGSPTVARTRALSSTPSTSTPPPAAAGIWTIQSGIFPENAASLAVHARAGFRVIGTRERIGRHHGAWRDVVLLERRSPRVG